MIPDQRDPAATSAADKFDDEHRRMNHAHVITGLRVTPAAGSVSPDVLAIEARKHAAAPGDTTVEASPPQRSRSKVVSLP